MQSDQNTTNSPRSVAEVADVVAAELAKRGVPGIVVHVDVEDDHRHYEPHPVAGPHRHVVVQLTEPHNQPAGQARAWIADLTAALGAAVGVEYLVYIFDYQKVSVQEMVACVEEVLAGEGLSGTVLTCTARPDRRYSVARYPDFRYVKIQLAAPFDGNVDHLRHKIGRALGTDHYVVKLTQDS